MRSTESVSSVRMKASQKSGCFTAVDHRRRHHDKPTQLDIFGARCAALAGIAADNKMAARTSLQYIPAAGAQHDIEDSGNPSLSSPVPLTHRI